MRAVCATHNSGKLREFAGGLIELGITLVAPSTLGIAAPVEDRESFVENALIKARHAARASGLPALADDSGLEVDALDGAPGLYSARYAGVDADDEANRRALLAALRDIPPDRRQARFYCVLVWVRHAADPRPVIADGVWEGRILTAPQGQAGFGYDPLFYVPDRQCSAAELALAEKHAISHRGQALRALTQALHRLYG
ncbi:MAG: RdgB/HAM1 family non-canonical purine NTP pyrophosphatase [Acidiferrobacter sp.]